MPPRRESSALEYAVRPLDEREAAPVESWTTSATTLDDTVVVSFTNAYCPVCRHDALPPAWAPRTISRGALGLAAAGRPVEEQIVVRCACREPHPGRPVTEPFGCGRAWTVTFAWDDMPSVGPVTPGPMPGPSDLAFATRIAELEEAELQRVRAQAAGWSTVMAGLAGLIGAAQLFVGPELAAELASPWDDLVGAALIVAIVCAALSSVTAGLAAYGRVGSIDLKGTAAAGGEAGALRRETRQMVAATRPLLITAAVAAAAAFVIALLVGAAIWWAPRADPLVASPFCVEGPDGSVLALAGPPEIVSGSLPVLPCPP